MVETGVDRDFASGLPWHRSGDSECLLVERWQRLESWWAPSLAFSGLSLAIAGTATACTHLIFWLLSRMIAD
jgi:hypothetical protein